MGKGCGSVDSWIAYLKKGKVIIELLGVSKKMAIIAFNAVRKRLPIQFEIIQREVIDA
jgi:ribosomal protein L16/L10AE